ncbi:MAG: flavodoxin-dependent (E)-4-hydroxy-3-methylbut-2-enyl-diphosphate synthase [Oscillospiraceae bacterium]
MNRKKTRQVVVGGIPIGGGAPVTIQSMLSLPWSEREGNLAQARELEAAGCQILRVAVPNMESVGLVSALKKAVSMPIVADIHFDWRLALASVEAGADKIRINPGNIGSEERVKEVAHLCGARRIPIRVGVNSGSIEQSILAKYGHPTPEAMVESALYHASLLEEYDFDQIVLSMKSNDVPVMMAAYRLLSGQSDYPLHLGVTHTGTAKMGLLKSAIGIGGLLAEGIGDTVRVSLLAPTVEEIAAAKDILKAAGLGGGVEIIACPTCGRTTTDVMTLTAQVDEALKDVDFPITVAVMGCAVNGPGEAREADLGVTGGGGGKCALFAKGKLLYTVPEAEAIPALLREVEKIKQNLTN